MLIQPADRLLWKWAGAQEEGAVAEGTPDAHVAAPTGAVQACGPDVRAVHKEKHAPLGAMAKARLTTAT